MKLIRVAAIATFLAAATVPALAQSDYPERGIRIIYGFAAGTDVVVRLLADKLADVFGKPITVDNVTGRPETSPRIGPPRPTRTAIRLAC
jgi:tripartite-type tricarboxylate transporter receptor subunit TctC